MVRRFVIACCLVVFGLAVVAGCTQSASKGSPAGASPTGSPPPSTTAEK